LTEVVHELNGIGVTDLPEYGVMMPHPLALQLLAEVPRVPGPPSRGSPDEPPCAESSADQLAGAILPRRGRSFRGEVPDRA
jgi:hypothetical protein